MDNSSSSSSSSSSSGGGGPAQIQQLVNYDCTCEEPYYQNCTDSQGQYQVRGTSEKDATQICTRICKESCETKTSNLAFRTGMNKETFYAAMGWEDKDKVEPWERWGLVGPEIVPKRDISTWYVIVLIVFIALGGWAASVSWRYNSQRTWGKPISVERRVNHPPHRINPFMRCIHALFAFYFGPIYLFMVQISDRKFLLHTLQEQLQALPVATV